MTHPIRLYGDPFLRRPVRRVGAFDDALEALADELIDTMAEADGVGLAATQIGVDARIFVMSGYANGLPDPDAPPSPEEERAAVVVVVNPELLDRQGRQLAVEGCLSLPGLVHDAIPRDARLRLRYQDLRGTFVERDVQGREAVVVQHESDHLDGVLFIDRLAEADRREFMEEHRAALAEFQRDARAFLKQERAQRRASGKRRR
ncbi:peptide deformylase [soil metagenome]|nr:peptide deformylase [Trueperaceae bacterium]